jgi:stearoyl-CoA desaturase (delta-9 desaturase)
VAELQALKGEAAGIDTAMIKRWLRIEKAALPEAEQAKRELMLSSSNSLKTIYQMREELAQLWQRSNASTDQLVKQLENWCHRAESSGIVALERFSKRLRCYA